MSRRSSTSVSGAELSPRRQRERSNSTSSASNSGSGGSGGVPATSPQQAPGGTPVQFIPIRSRVGKRYQAVIPDLLVSLAEKEAVAERLWRQQALQQPRPRYDVDRAKALGGELEKYLRLARSLRDGATFDTQEQVTTLALQYLHRFDYNTTDAACSLYARHSIELPRSAVASVQDAAGSSQKSTAAEGAKKWLIAFYRCMRQPQVDTQTLEKMHALLDKAQASDDAAPATEKGVLTRLVGRISSWKERCEAASREKVDRATLLQLLHEAENMQLAMPEKDTIASRLSAFDHALVRLKETLERATKRHHHHHVKKVGLEELVALYDAVLAARLSFPEEEHYGAVVGEAKTLKQTIEAMLAEDKVGLTAMRELIAKIDLVPVDFEVEVEQFQKKMLSAQTWLAKARKCMPKRRATRRGTGTDPKKTDLDAIRALVDDAPCDDSTEMFEMQDLLECADEWAEKVKKAMEGGADVSLEHLKELMSEGKDIPVDMDEQKFLEAEVAAREWCTTAASMLASRKSIEEMEVMTEQARDIRKRIHPKKQSRWKPQVERDIHAALEQAHRWINELRDHLGASAFDKMFSSLSSYVSTPSSHSSRPDSASSTSTTERAKKKPMDAISKLVEKAQMLAVDVSSYTTPVNDLLLKGIEAQAEATAILMGIGQLSTAEKDENSAGGTDSSNGVGTGADVSVLSTASTQEASGDLAQASALLEQIDAFPFTFEEGLTLAGIIDMEKSWAQRVRDGIPPRQSRKKRQGNDPFTMDQLHALLVESKRLRFLFPEEMRILKKELEDLNTWRAKVHDVVDGQANSSIAQVVKRLQAFDLLVYDKLQRAKKKLHIGDTTDNPSTVAVGNIDADGDAKMEAPSEFAGPSTIIKNEDEGADRPVDGDVEMADATAVTPATKKEAVMDKGGQSNGNLTFPQNGVQAASSADTKPVFSTAPGSVDVPMPEINTDSIMTHIRIESGCMQKSLGDQEDGDSSTAEDSNKSWAARNGRVLLEPVLAMVEESLAAVNSLELKEEEARKTVEELVLNGGDGGDIPENITDESVRALDAWRQQLVQVQGESDLLSVVAPEQQALSFIVTLLEWLQGARSIFYDEVLPLRELVVKGNKLAEDLKALKPLDAVKPESFELLELMLWPLPYLESHEKVVVAWTERVRKCVADKHAHVEELQALLDDGSGLLLEQDAFKVVLDEARRAKLWLSKLKKRVKSLMSKRMGRMSLSAARSLVEEAENLAIDLPVFDLLKEHVETASDWENRVLSSGLETGQARITNLLALLNEYECARLVIDLDMHREVLKSATERYCICRQPFDGLMIGCDHCDDWFHDNCIGMSKDKAEKVEHYTCPSCTILQELSSMLQQAKTSVQQSEMWDLQEYAKAFEKQQGSALRKIKREEKSIERSEMLLFSCNNKMGQLRARIEDIERAKTCLSISHAAPNGQFQPQQSPATSTSSTPGTPALVTGNATSLAPSLAVGTNALLLAAAATAPASAGANSSRSNPSVASGISASGVAAASALAGMDAMALSRQQYPNILLPPSRPGVNGRTSAPPRATMTPAVPSTAVAHEKSMGKPIAAAVAVTTTGGTGDQAKELVTTAGPAPAQQVLSSLSTPTSVSAPAQRVISNSAELAAATSAPLAQQSSATVSNVVRSTGSAMTGSTERLAALVVAGGVEQQLGKIKAELVEAKKQVQDLQESLKLSRDRLANAQQTLRELTEVFEARHRVLPVAQAWVRRAVVLLNTTGLLSRSKIDASSYLPSEYASALAELKPVTSASAASTPTTTPTTSSSITSGIENLFPGVSTYARLLRVASWSLVVVSMLQERPSRSELCTAITYAAKHALWEDKKVLGPLRAVISRVDAWVSRAHKCMTKTSNKVQRVARLKVLLNEYSKLPLTCPRASSPLEVYVKLADGEDGDTKTSNEGGPLTLEAASAAAVKALDDTMAAFAAASSATAAAVSAAKQKQKPKQQARKRKYVRKDKAPARSSKKSKPQDDPAPAPGSMSSSAQTASLTPPTASSTSQKDTAKASVVEANGTDSPNTAASA